VTLAAQWHQARLMQHMPGPTLTEIPSLDVIKKIVPCDH